MVFQGQIHVISIYIQRCVCVVLVFFYHFSFRVSLFLVHLFSIFILCLPLFSRRDGLMLQLPLFYVHRRLNRMERIQLLYLLIRLVNINAIHFVCVCGCLCVLPEPLCISSFVSIQSQEKERASERAMKSSSSCRRKVVHTNIVPHNQWQLPVFRKSYVSFHLCCHTNNA